MSFVRYTKNSKLHSSYLFFVNTFYREDHIAEDQEIETEIAFDDVYMLRSKGIDVAHIFHFLSFNLFVLATMDCLMVYRDENSCQLQYVMMNKFGIKSLIYLAIDLNRN